MILAIDPHSGVPVYRQIINQVRFHVSSGLLEPGDEIPSTRAVSKELGVNPMTISKAFALLEEEGVLERRPGLPHVVRRRRTDALHATKIGQLEETLRPVVTKTRQLGLDRDEATAVFRRLLGEGER
jgi:GntR family transcriptional regulator